mgnify:CR=1 FL=1
MDEKFKMGDEVIISNHPDKKMIGKKAVVKNIGFGRFNQDSGVKDQNVYHVFDGKKSLGWAPESSLQTVQQFKRIEL